MLICSKRKKCEVKDCPHATKHLESSECQHPPSCPDYLRYRNSNHEKSRRCKTCSMSINKISRKVVETKHKIREPITQYEAQQALYNLKNLALVEKRMTGESNVQLKNIDTTKIINGLPITFIKEIFPDATSRGLNRFQIISALQAEEYRQTQLQIKRRMRRVKYDPETTYNIRKENRLFDVRNALLNQMRNILSSNSYYFIIGNKLCAGIEKRDDINIPNVEFYISGTKRKDKQSNYTISIPINTIIKSIQNILVVTYYEDKNSSSFPCFALIKNKTNVFFTMTEVVNNKFADQTILQEGGIMWKNLLFLLY